MSDSSLGIAPDKSRIGGRIAIRNQRAPLRERRIGQIAVKQLGVKNKVDDTNNFHHSKHDEKWMSFLVRDGKCTMIGHSAAIRMTIERARASVGATPVECAAANC